MEKIDIKDLTQEQIKELTEQLKQKAAEQANRRKQDKETYEELKNLAIKESFQLLSSLSKTIRSVRERVFDNFADVLELKKIAYELTDEQMEKQESHTFTSSDGQLSIIIGSNTVDRWDETVDVGIIKVNEWLQSMAIDEESGKLVSFITDMLKPNKDGVLKANRILDLSKKAAEFGDKKLIEAVDLIREAYRPSKTSQYIKVKMKGENGQDVWLPLSMSF
ncbi:MAG: DUF3164 family protein [Bacteroidales bacterium]|nr:DUF3164 family protein [Bacteroidales bacterium]